MALAAAPAEGFSAESEFEMDLWRGMSQMMDTHKSERDPKVENSRKSTNLQTDLKGPHRAKYYWLCTLFYVVRRHFVAAC